MVPNTPDRIRTCDLSFRKAALYPTELLGRLAKGRVPWPKYSEKTPFVHLQTGDFSLGSTVPGHEIARGPLMDADGPLMQQPSGV
jgi:hypothetical protein